MLRLAIVLLICSILPTTAQQLLVNFDKNDFEKDIVYEHIDAVLIDSDGFNWIGTSTGLYQYNGYDITSFIHSSQDNTSISEDFVTTIFEDSRGLIWVGTYNTGVNVFDKKYQSFEHFYHNSSDSSTLSSNRIPREDHLIVEDKEGFIWINTNNALNRIDPVTKQVERHYGDLAGQITYHNATHTFWIGGSVLKRYDPVERKIWTYPNPNVSSPITSIISGSSDLIWIGTTTGAFIFNSAEGVFYTLDEFFGKDQKQHYSWANQPVSHLYKDFKGNVWMGIGNKIYIIDEKNGAFESLIQDKKYEIGLQSEKIGGIYGDKRGSILIAYVPQGITKINIDLNNFKRITNIGQQSNREGQVIARSILKDKRNNLWVGTNSNGLSVISGSGSGNSTTYLADYGNTNSLNSNYITAIYVDKGERLWVGTFENGFNYADNIYSGKRLKFISSKEKENFETHEFTEDIAGRIWICTNHGLFIYDKNTEEMVQYGNSKNQDSRLKSINVQALIQESPNVFWLATWNSGVVRLKINADSLLSRSNSKDELVIYDEIIDGKGDNLDNRIINIHMEDSEHFWLASNVDGLIRMSLMEDEVSFERYDESMGAPSNQVFSILEDQKGFIWISTMNGIGKLNPSTKQFSNYYESDGLLSNSFVWDSYFQSEDGEIFFGGFDGITAFDPDSLLLDESTHQAYLINMNINHLPIHIGDTVNEHFILDKSIRFMESIILTHHESVIAFEFGALDLINANEIQFAYKLDGFDEDWIYTRTDNRQATYTNLQPGSYNFKVRAFKNFNSIGTTESVLKITVLPPWWKTYWAYLLYLMIFGGLLYLFQQELVNRSKIKNHLEMEKYKREQDNQLNREKFQFFTTLSHELRTPLTLILGPLERMINNHEGNNRVLKNLLLMQKQAIRLQKLTNQLMNFRKYELENLKLRAAEGNIIYFIKEIYVAFKQHAEMKQIHFQLSHQEENIKLFYDRDKLEIVIVNLLSNAFKFTPQEGMVNLDIAQIDIEKAAHLIQVETETPKAVYGEFSEKTRKLVQIKVSDTGIGIQPDQVAKVFQRYFQASNIQNISIGGTGIGLEIAKNYVELHHGCIMVESEINLGTTFHIWIPLGRLHLSDSDILQDFKPSEHQDHYRKSDLSIPEKNIDAYEDVRFPQFDENIPTLLIVDDNPDIIYFLKETFQGSYNILTAQNGNIGLEKAFENIPDLIISDIMMPKIDGLELCKKIKTDVRTSHIPVILLTARISEVFHTEGLETGADDYINKPFDEKVLKLRVKNLLASRKKLRERYANEAVLMPSDISITNPDEEFLKKVIQIIDDHIAESDLKVEWIAREIGMSHSVLYKKVMALTDHTLVEFIRTTRLKKSSQLLVKSNQPINNISMAVGFTDPKYFSKCFHKLYGVTPTDYKKQNC